MTETETLIIGAGVTGLTLARKLGALNRPCMILEKSRGLGGRIATRRIDNQGLDHGAPYLHQGKETLELLNELGLGDELHSSSEGLFIAGGMNRIAKIMSENLSIRKNTRAEKIYPSNDKWVIETEQGERFIAKNVVLTAPVPQCLELLKENHLSFHNQRELATIKYSMGLLGIIVCNRHESLHLPTPGVAAILNMSERGLHPQVYVLRTSPEYAERSFDRSDEENIKALRELFNQSFSHPPEVTHLEIKKWRYLLPLSVFPHPFLEVLPSLYLAGDAFLYPDLRGALISAQQLALNLTR